MAEKEKKQHGGRRAGAGRKRGSNARATRDQKITLADLARSHATTAIETLVILATQADSDSAKISACKELLDRGYGRAPQAVEHEGDLTFNIISAVPRPEADAN